MGLTLSDRNKMIYSNFISSGMTHAEAINSFPEYKRKQVLNDLDKDPIESHFGMNPLWFLVTILATIIGTVIFGLCVG